MDDDPYPVSQDFVELLPQLSALDLAAMRKDMRLHPRDRLFLAAIDAEMKRRAEA